MPLKKNTKGKDDGESSDDDDNNIEDIIHDVWILEIIFIY